MCHKRKIEYFGETQPYQEFSSAVDGLLFAGEGIERYAAQRFVGANQHAASPVQLAF